MNEPKLTIIIGANGAGKTTWTRKHRDELPQRFYNADPIADGLGSADDPALQREARRFIDDQIERDLAQRRADAEPGGAHAHVGPRPGGPACEDRTALPDPRDRPRPALENSVGGTTPPGRVLEVDEERPVGVTHHRDLQVQGRRRRAHARQDRSPLERPRPAQTRTEGAHEREGAGWTHPGPDPGRERHERDRHRPRPTPRHAVRHRIKAQCTRSRHGEATTAGGSP